VVSLRGWTARSRQSSPRPTTVAPLGRWSNLGGRARSPGWTPLQKGPSDPVGASTLRPTNPTATLRVGHGTPAELHLASLRFVDTAVNLGDTDYLAFTALKDEIADVLGGPPRGIPQIGASIPLASNSCSRSAVGPCLVNVRSKAFSSASKLNFAAKWWIYLTRVGSNLRRRVICSVRA
jgi:hypothetical protein